VDPTGRITLAELAHARLPELMRFGYALTGSPEDAADLVQEALTRVAARWWALARQDDPEGYVRKTMVNVAISRWRRRRREVLVERLPVVASYDPDPIEHQDVWRALRSLPARQRAVMVLRYYDDLSEQEIAALLGCSTGTVKSQAAKARSKLRMALGEPCPPAGVEVSHDS
jgi:RNA polymerase sigma-70 factor (sigma-E family)